MSLPFGSSQRSTIGVEWELQLVDRDSHDLRQSADAIIDRATTDGKLYPGVHREMLRSWPSLARPLPSAWRT